MAPASDDAANAIKGFKTPADLKVELFAAEPMLAHPVAMCTDDQGRLYIAETWRFSDGISGGGDKDFGALDLRGHMDWLDQDLANHTPEDRRAMLERNLGPNISWLKRNSEIVRLLVDADGSGKATRSTIFADGFDDVLDGAAAGVLAYDGSVYLTCIPNLWLLRDTTGSGSADVKKVLHSGFGCRIAFLGHDLHGLAMGPDGKLYFSIGDRGFNVESDGKKMDMHERGGVFRCYPDGSEFEVVATGLRNPQKLAFDRWGNLFTADNNADHGDSARWVYIMEGGDSGWRGGYQFITQPSILGPWTAEKMWFDPHEGQPAFIVPPVKGLGTGPSGIGYFPGTGLPARYDNHFFYCDFIGNGGIFTFSVKPKGAGFEFVEDREREFFWRNKATDLCFGVGGGVYVCEWFGGIQKSGKGRVYRVFDPKLADDPLVLETKRLLHEGMEKRESSALIHLLEHPDLRVRQNAQFALARRGSASLPLLQEALANKNQLARIHAVWAIGQIAHALAQEKFAPEQRSPSTPWNDATLAPLLPLLGDADDEIAAQAARALGDGRLPAAAQPLVKLLAHTNARVRAFAAYGVGKLAAADAVEPVCVMLRANSDKDQFLRHAGVMALYWIAEKYPDAVIAKAADPSASVRMAVLLVLRRLEDARIAQFLHDSSPLVAVEAARAINDVPIPTAFSDLAKLAEGDGERKDDAKFGFHAEYWENVLGSSVADLLREPRYPDHPDSTQELPIFETPSDRADNYGARVSGILTAPQTGDYIFWIAVDDCGQLWLSTDETREHKKLLCETKVPQWCKPREWEKYASQKSAPVHLEAGRRYYIEALMKEVIRNDNLAVGWQLPDGSRQRPIGNNEREENPALMRRVLNAGFRLGQPENAQTLAAYAARKNAGSALRAEALSMLADWAAPPPRDRIMNLVRPLEPRDPAPAANALRARVDAILTTAAPNDVVIAAAQACAKLNVAEAAAPLDFYFQDTKRPADVRIAAVNALFELHWGRAEDDVRLAASSKDQNLRKAGNALLAKLKPADAIASIRKALESPAASITEKQNALGILGGMKNPAADALISEWLDKLIAGNTPEELELDILESAEKSQNKEFAERLAKHAASRPRLEHKTVQLSDFAAALKGGDAEEGRRLFFEGASAQCIRCHKVSGQGGDFGPELKGIGTRESREYLLESIVDPSAKIAKGYETVVVKLNDGKVLTGILKKESDTLLTLMPPDGKPLDILKSEIKLRKNQEESTMPPMGTVLSRRDLRNLIEFLSSLKEPRT